MTAIYGQQTSDTILYLLDIKWKEDAVQQHLYLCDNHEAVTVEGQAYVGFPFKTTIPDDDGEGLTAVTLTACNVDRVLGAAIQEAASRERPGVDVSIALIPSAEGAPPAPTIEAGPYEFTLLEGAYIAETVTMSLGFETFYSEPYPGDTMTPARYPALFSGAVEDVGDVMDAPVPSMPRRGAAAFIPWRKRFRSKP